jgi:hypothetical protein
MPDFLGWWKGEKKPTQRGGKKGGGGVGVKGGEAKRDVNGYEYTVVKWGGGPKAQKRKHTKTIPYRSFQAARSFARALKLKNKAGWMEYIKGGLRPRDIPFHPDRMYV